MTTYTFPNNAKWSYEYAKNTLKDRFLLGEAKISKDNIYSLLYARDVIKGRFELGEKVISEHVLYALLYAIDIIKERFPQGEGILGYDDNCYTYMVHIMRYDHK